jgi:hypothetical protein
MNSVAENTPRRVRVEGRDDVGVVIDAGKNIGNFRPMYCVGVHFPSTGEVVYYDAQRVRDAQE